MHLTALLFCVVAVNSSTQAATAGRHSSVVAFEPEKVYLDRGKERIENSISKLVSKGKMTQEDADKALGSIQWTTDMKDLASVDFVVEAGACVYKAEMLVVTFIQGAKPLRCILAFVQSLKTWI